MSTDRLEAAEQSLALWRRVKTENAALRAELAEERLERQALAERVATLEAHLSPAEWNAARLRLLEADDASAGAEALEAGRLEASLGRLIAAGEVERFVGPDGEDRWRITPAGRAAAEQRRCGA